MDYAACTCITHSLEKDVKVEEATSAKEAEKPEEKADEAAKAKDAEKPEESPEDAAKESEKCVQEAEMTEEKEATAEETKTA